MPRLRLGRFCRDAPHVADLLGRLDTQAVATSVVKHQMLLEMPHALQRTAWRVSLKLQVSFFRATSAKSFADMAVHGVDANSKLTRKGCLC